MISLSMYWISWKKSGKNCHVRMMWKEKQRRSATSPWLRLDEKRIIRQIKRADRKGLEMQRGMERKMHGTGKNFVSGEKVRK